MARYFKIVEIDCDSFIEATGEDLDCCQLAVPTSEGVFVAIDEDECEMSIDMEMFEEVEDDGE